MNWDEMTAAERLEAWPDLAECVECGGLGGEHYALCSGDDLGDYDLFDEDGGEE